MNIVDCTDPTVSEFYQVRHSKSPCDPDKLIGHRSIPMASYLPRLSPLQVHTWRLETSLAWSVYTRLWMKAKKLLSTDSKVNQSTGLTLQKNYPPLIGRILRESTSQLQLPRSLIFSRPLNAIGTPYYNTLLLSSWTKSLVPSRPKYFPPPDVIPPQILNTMKLNDNIAYAAVPKELKGRRNMVADVKKDKGARFRSGKRADVSAPG